MENPSQIQIERETRDRLSQERIAKKESYDEVINRLIDFKHKTEEDKRKEETGEIGTLAEE